MVIIIEILIPYCLENYWDIFMVKYLFLIKKSNWDLLMANSLSTYLNM